MLYSVLQFLVFVTSAIIIVFSIPPNRSKSPHLLCALHELRVKIPTQPVLPIAPTRRTTHRLPTFSTPSKHGPHTNTRKPFPLYRLLHTSLYTGGVGHIRPDPIHAAPRRTPQPAHNSFRCNAYRKSRGPVGPRVAAPLTIHHSLPTSHFPNHFATLCLRGTP